MFVAVVPPPEAVEDLDEFLARRRDAAAFRWTPPEHFHVTLAFLASVPDRALDDLADRLRRAAARRTPFRTRLAGGGAFPHADRARVVWTGLDLDPPSAEELRRAADGVRAAATRAGIEVDGQRFRAHVTVARLGRPENVTRWVRLLDAYAGPPWAVEELTLVASYLGQGPRNRPRHEVVDTFPLRQASQSLPAGHDRRRRNHGPTRAVALGSQREDRGGQGGPGG